MLKAMSCFPGNRFILISTPELGLPSYVKDILNASNCEYEEISSLEEALPKLESPLFSEQARTAEGEGIYNICIAKRPEASNSELLRALGERYEILSFAEEIPSMHDIFIQVVENNPLKTE